MKVKFNVITKVAFTGSNFKTVLENSKEIYNAIAIVGFNNEEESKTIFFLNSKFFKKQFKEKISNLNGTVDYNEELLKVLKEKGIRKAFFELGNFKVIKEGVNPILLMNKNIAA